MPEYPLLVFPEASHLKRAKLKGGGTKVHVPAAEQQVERLVPQLQRLQQAMDHQRLALQNNPVGLQPEQTLVLETIGPIQNFINAAKKIEGLEWLGEYELDEIAPEYGFKDTKDPEKYLKRQLFLMMTDQRALTALQNLFRRWSKDRQ